MPILFQMFLIYQMKGPNAMTKDEFKQMFVEEIERLADEYGFSTNIRNVFVTDGQVSLNVSLYGDVKGIMNYYSELNEESPQESSVIQIDSSIVNDNEVLEEVYANDVTGKSQAV